MADSKYIKFIPKLTKRELEVIEAVLAGALRYKSIASSLNISVNTVKTHLRKIYLIVGVNNTEALMSLFRGYSSNNTNITPKSPQKNKKSPQIGDRNQHFYAVIIYNIMHLGGTKMQKLKVLRKRTLVGISSVLVIALVIGFMAVRLVSGNWQTNMNFWVNAETVPDGILLTFSNIPEDTVHINVSLRDVTRNDYRKAYFDSAIDLEGNDLVKLKEIKTLLCPFVKNGHEYTIVINYWHDGWDTEEYKGDTQFIINSFAGGGISPMNNPLLCFNEENKILVLSEKPIFSEGVTYTQEYSKNTSLYFYFCVGVENNILKKEDDRIYYGSIINHSDELFCDVLDIYNKYNGIEQFIISGIIGCKVIYNDLQWVVGIANTEEITVSL